jgi:hypothetical protein
MEQAVDISRREIPRYFPDVPTWEVRGVSLQSLCCPRKWYYVIKWLPPSASGDALSIPVLLSGRALELIRNENSESQRTSAHEGKAPSNNRLKLPARGRPAAGAQLRTRAAA